MNTMKSNLLLLCLLSATMQLRGQAKQNLPQFDKEKITVQKDWLLGGTDAKAALYAAADGQVILSNGLVSRRFTTYPNTASIGLEELSTNTAFLRSIRPEASVMIDGFSFDVGGLEGQKVHNYLLKEWIPELKANPMAFKMYKYVVEDIKPRFGWKKRPEWMPKDMPWPAAGKEVVFSYRLDQQAIDALVQKSKTDANRNLLLEDKFQTPNNTWKLMVSKSHERNSFMNEGKFGEIMALQNSAVYAERAIPEKAKVIIAKVNKGTDSSDEFGLGLGVTVGGRKFRLNLQGTEGKVVFAENGKNEGTLDVKKASQIWFRVELENNTLYAQASLDGSKWQEVGRVKLKQGDKIEFARVGKIDPNGEGKDGLASTKEGRSKVDGFWVYSDFPSHLAGDLTSKLAYMKDVEVLVHYELYDNLPVFSKWITVNNHSAKKIVLNEFKSEQLAVFEPESSVDYKDKWLLPNITLETDYSFGGMSDENIYSSSVSWKEDPLYGTQVNYDRQTPCLLEVAPKIGPEQDILPGAKFDSYRVWELLNDSWNRERKSLAYRKMMRTVSPWVTENPILMHVRSSDSESVKKAIDQAAEVGFEMVIMTFWSGFNAEDASPENLSRMKELADYAHSKNVELGGYSLLASRSIDAKNDVVLPAGKTARFGNSPCIESEWGHDYFNKLYTMYEKTGLGIFEHDGSYPGDCCYSTEHPGHKNEKDSQWNQFKRTTDFYKWCREKGIYLNIPDTYYMNGGNKTGMGYREANWSLPRAQQEIIERQNIYDGTWLKTPSMGWMFVPLVEYQGGGKEATIEPLKDHLPHYEQRLANLFGAGVQACYRGPQLYDSPETKAVVTKWVDFYKKYRDVLDSDIIHVRRPDGMDYDAILHANPTGVEKGLLMVYNPLDEPIKRSIKVNLYYTGLTTEAQVFERGEMKRNLKLNRDYEVVFEVEIPAKGQSWFVIK